MKALKKIPLAISLMWYYIIAQVIICLHYDREKFVSGKWFKGGKWGKFTASGWKWVVNDYFACRKLHVNQNVKWPVSPDVRIVTPQNIQFHPDDLNNFQIFGNYYQAFGHISIGRGTYIAPNVGLITANHSINALEEHDQAKPIILGEKCWIGMNAVILPGVHLGPRTIVGAGAVVTKSFIEGNCIIAGNPAKKIREIVEKA